MAASVLFAEKKKKKKKKKKQQQQRKKKSLGLAEEEEESKRYCKTLVEIDVNNSKGRYSPHPGGVG